MKRFKQIDLWVNIILIVVFAVFSFVNQDETFLYGYFVVGGWQVFSMLVHAYAGWFTEKGSVRKNYHWITFIIILMSCWIFIIPLLIFIFYILLFAAPFMAIFYTGMCYQELKALNSRPLAVLK